MHGTHAMYKRVTGEKPRFSDTVYGDDSETLLSGSEAPLEGKIRSSSQAWLGRAVFLVVFFAVSAALGAWVSGRGLVDRDAVCARRLTQYSPVIKDVDISFGVVRFNGSLLKENVFRQMAGPAVDAAWESLGVDYRSVVVPASEGLKSGFLPHQVQVSQKYGGGFLANVEGLHQLHCLNLVRKSLYYNFDHYYALRQGPFSNSDHILQLHVSHCLDIIRQQLMCTLDTGLLGQIWFNPEEPEAFVDFNTQHKCKNFDDVRKWANAHQAPEDVPFDYLQPPKRGDKIYEHIP